MARTNSNSRSSSSGSSNRGFAAMDKEKQRKIASKGGKASHGGRSSSRSRQFITSSNWMHMNQNENEEQKATSNLLDDDLQGESSQKTQSELDRDDTSETA